MKQFRRIFICSLMFFLGFSVFAEQTEQEKRNDILSYGLEGDVTELVSTLMNDNDESCNTELLALFNKTRSTAIRDSIIALFAKQKKTDLQEYTLTVLQDPYDTTKSTVLAVFGYVVDVQIKDALPSIRKILENENSAYRDQAINALGKLGDSDDAKILADYLDNDLDGDEKQRLIIRQNVMAALGTLKSVDTLEKLSAIVANTDENANIRATAAVAIGSIGKTESIPVLVKLFESTDPVLRAASVDGLSNFTSKEATDTIIEGFKDSYYKVRIRAISASQKIKLAEAIPYLLYRAKNDPEKSVQFAAYDALGSFNDSDSNAWLKSVFLDISRSDEIRMKACSVLIKNNFEYIFSDIEKIVEVVLKDDKKTWLRYEIGKLLASTETQETSGIARSYFAHKDVSTRSLGLDMFAKNRYADMRPLVEALAADEKQGALQRRAKRILEKEK